MIQRGIVFVYIPRTLHGFAFANTAARIFLRGSSRAARALFLSLSLSLSSHPAATVVFGWWCCGDQMQKEPWQSDGTLTSAVCL